MFVSGNGKVHRRDNSFPDGDMGLCGTDLDGYRVMEGNLEEINCPGCKPKVVNSSAFGFGAQKSPSISEDRSDSSTTFNPVGEANRLIEGLTYGQLINLSTLLVSNDDIEILRAVVKRKLSEIADTLSSM